MRFYEMVYPELLNIAVQNNIKIRLQDSCIEVESPTQTISDGVRSKLDGIFLEIKGFLNLSTFDKKGISCLICHTIPEISPDMYKDDSHSRVVMIKPSLIMIKADNDGLEDVMANQEGKNKYHSGRLVTIDNQNRQYDASKIMVHYNNNMCSYFFPFQLEDLFLAKGMVSVNKNQSGVARFFEHLAMPVCDIDNLTTNAIDLNMFDGYILTKGQIDDFLNKDGLREWHDSIILNKKSGSLKFAKRNLSGIGGEFGMNMYFGNNEFSSYTDNSGDWIRIAELLEK